MNDEIDYTRRINEESLKNSLLQNAEAYYQNKEYENALVSYENIIRLDFQNPHIYVRAGDGLRSLQEYSAAARAYEKAIQIDPLYVSAYNGICYTYIKRGYYTTALRFHEKAIEIDPNNADSYNGKGHILHNKHQCEEALIAFDKAIELSEGNYAGYHYNKSLALSGLGRYDEALDACIRAIQLDPSKTKYIKERDKVASIILHRGVSKQQAYIHIKKTKSVFDYLNDGKTFYECRQYQEALRAYELALNISPSEIQAYKGKGDALLGLERYEEALLAYNTISLKTSVLSIYENKGKALFKVGRLNEALQLYEAALTIDTTLAPAFAGKGDIFFEQKHSMEALKSYAEAIRLDSNNVYCYINTGLILWEMHFLDQAVLKYKEALLLDPNNAFIHLSLGQVLFDFADYEDAIIFLEKAILLDAKEKEIALLRKGDILAIFGKTADASIIYDECISLLNHKIAPNIIQDIINKLSCSYRPINIQLKLFLCLLRKDYSDTQANTIFSYISTQYDNLFNTNTVSSEDFLANIQTLKELLDCIPTINRGQALLTSTKNDSRFIIHLLIHLAPFGLSGLTAFTRQMMKAREHDLPQDSLVTRFYQALPGYAIPQEEIDIFFAQFLIVQKNFEQLEIFLSPLAYKMQANPEILWLLAHSLCNLEKSPQYEVELLERFVTLVPTNSRVATAYQRIGDLYGSSLGDGDKAVAAYKEAERGGCSIPQMQAFRRGDWSTIPALQTHPDYAYPPIVVLDLENDYLPDAALGSRVVEVGAVRAKGHTELDTYQAVVQRSFIASKVSQQQSEAKVPEQVVQELETFFAETYGDLPILVGHNIQAFDALQLRGMSISIHDNQLVDTLILARHLYPDSLHHNLELLCHIHHISFIGKAHTALPDARACLRLLHALGDELVQCGDGLIAGFRAFTPPNSAFDKAVLQPRNIAADPTCTWELNPNPTSSRILVLNKNSSPSPGILNALETKFDALIERYDPTGSYIQHLPNNQRSMITINTRTRLECMLSAVQERSDVFVLPDPHTLLCPHRLQRHIEEANNNQTKLLLFCLYQASHNHDASTLYPLRLSNENAEIVQGLELGTLRKILLNSCCENSFHHSVACPASTALDSAMEHHHILLATHEIFIQQEQQVQADMIIVDDIGELQMSFAQYISERITSKQVEQGTFNDNEKKALADIRKLIDRYIRNEMNNVGSHERINLQTFAPYLLDIQDGYEQSILSLLQASGPSGKKVACLLEDFCQQASQKAHNPTYVHVYWLDLLFSHDTDESCNVIDEWGFYGLSRNLQHAFRELFWHPYKQHILCGTAISLGNSGTTFLKNYFGLSNNIVFCLDERPHSQIYIPRSEEIRPASFLAQYSWAMSVGRFLYALTNLRYNSILVSIHAKTIANVLINTLKEHMSTDTQVLSPTLGWTITKITERISNVQYKTLTIVSPRLRQMHIREPIDVEVTGPMRFMNTRDPLVAAQMLAYMHSNKDTVNEGTFTTYLLPQALLELKARVSSSAKLHIILDSSLRESFYKDEVHSLFKTNEILDILSGMSLQMLNVPELFTNSLSSNLQERGLDSNTTVTEKDLLLTLKTLWKADSFRKSPLNQQEVVQNVLAHKDQLVIAPTGGGKSLCFQLPAILMAQDMPPKVTIIFSPLVALMKDQVQALHDKGIFSAMYFDSTHSQQDYLRGIRRGDYSIIYVAPEKIHNAAFRKAIQHRDVGFIAFDEAHCVSQWGHDFRTDYFAVKQWIDKHILQYRERAFPLLALTATARKGYIDKENLLADKENSTVGDIIKKLGLDLTEEQVVVPSLERKELQFQVEHIKVPYAECPHTKNKEFKRDNSYCEDCNKDVTKAKLDKLIALLTDTHESGLQQRWSESRQRGLIYCAYTATIEVIAGVLRNHPLLKGILRVGTYYAKKKSEDQDDTKDNTYKRFVDDGANGLDIIIATNAFGMGIDVRRLGFVIHFDTPGTPEAYYQEAGRAGRDREFQEGEDHAQCILLYHESDLGNQRYLSNKNVFTEGDIKTVYTSLREWHTTHLTDEVIITESELAVMSNVDEEKIDSIIHYLEHNTQSKFNHKTVIRRGESARHVLQLKFEQDYKAKTLHDANNIRDNVLLHVFEAHSEWHLNEQSTIDIDMYSLLTYFNASSNLRWNIGDLNNAIFGLVAGGVLAHKSKGRIFWKSKKDDALKALNEVEQEIYDILSNMSKVDRDNFKNLSEIHLDFTKTSLAQFLFALSRENAGELRLFEILKRDTHFYKSKRYKVKRWKGQTKQTQVVLAEIFRQLQQVVQRFTPEVLQVNDPMIFDLLEVTNAKEERQHLDQRMYWLDILGIVSYTREYGMESALRIEFLQKGLSASDLYMDMKEHNQAKINTERKLLLMKEYAMLQPEQRADFFEKYFRGEISLT